MVLLDKINVIGSACDKVSSNDAWNVSGSDLDSSRVSMYVSISPSGIYTLNETSHKVST